jgi:hypothetical protein
MDIRLRDWNRARSSRENKRRHRQRQKEYTAELESKLRHLQSEGIKATLEVQAAAKKVFEDNLRLKALLRSAGIDKPTTINTGTPRGAISNPSPAEGKAQARQYVLSEQHNPTIILTPPSF